VPTFGPGGHFHSAEVDTLSIRCTRSLNARDASNKTAEQDMHVIPACAKNPVAELLLRPCAIVDWLQPADKSRAN